MNGMNSLSIEQSITIYEVCGTRGFTSIYGSLDRNLVFCAISSLPISPLRWTPPIPTVLSTLSYLLSMVWGCIRCLLSMIVGTSALTHTRTLRMLYNMSRTAIYEDCEHVAFHKCTSDNGGRVSMYLVDTCDDSIYTY
jgi:hypothetical protein